VQPWLSGEMRRQLLVNPDSAPPIMPCPDPLCVERHHMKFSLKTKLLLVIGLLGAVPLLGVTLNSYNITLSKHAAEKMDVAWQGAQYLERINGLVYAAVMESRGIYMWPDWKTAEPFAKKLLQDLADIETTANLWKSRLIDSERGRIDDLARDIAQFIEFRKELVRRAQFETTESARAYGDNDANRKVRSALNDKLVALNKIYAAHTGSAEREVERIDDLNQMILIGLASLAVVALGAGIFFVVAGLIRPLFALRAGMLNIAAGTLDLQVPGAERGDEIGEMVEAVVAFRDAAVEKIRRDRQRQAERQLRQAEERERLDAEARAKAIQSAALAQTSMSMDDISSTVKNNTENVQRANQITADTRELADHGSAVVAKAIKSMSNIEGSSRKISDIIGVIDEIASQTNLLALNAAVEAARAGEAGRGFGVVAAEVRGLAQRSSQAAKDIKELITSSSGQVKEGVDLVDQVGAALGKIVASVKSSADIVASIAKASVEQASALEQINKTLTQMGQGGEPPTSYADAYAEDFAHDAA
jgi:methyl-accepting chemotaxis protein